MLLAIDAGNSTVGFGFFEGENLAVTFKAESRRGATADEYWSFVTSQMERAGIGSAEVDAMVVASVVPHLVPVFFEALRGVSDATPLLVSPRLKLGVKIGYKTPETLGADRLAGASAAYSAYGGPVAVVDFGTATTFSVVDKDGTFLGGAIAPGLLTGYDALTEKAAGVPRVGLTFPKNAIGMSTGEGVQSGVIFGHAAMVHGMLEKFAAELEGELRTVVTGGLAKTLAPHIKVAHEVEPHLTLKGLAAIYRLNA